MGYRRFHISVAAGLLCFVCCFSGLRAAETPSVQDSLKRERRRNCDALFYVDFSPKKPVKDNFFTRIIRGNIDRTFEKKVDYSIVPVPTYLREGSFGLGVMTSLLYRLDRQDSSMRPSDLGFWVNATLRGFYRAELTGNTFFPGRRHELEYVVSFWQRSSLNFYGTNFADCSAHTASPARYTNLRFWVNALYTYRVVENFSVGAALDFSYTAGSLSRRYGEEEYRRFTEYLDGQRTSCLNTGIGFLLQYDSRDSKTYPTQGFNARVCPYYYPAFAGNTDKDFWRAEILFNYYRKLWRGAVLVFDLYGGLGGGFSREYNELSSMPWSMREETGGYYRMRGYYTGHYMDNNMASIQAELRQKLFWRVSMVVFGGGGVLFPSFRKADESEFLPSYGVGLRFEFKHKLNLRLDWAIGKNDNCILFTLGEAF